MNGFQTNGFGEVPALLDAAECAQLAALAVPSQPAAGTRCLLQHDWCASLARRLRAHPLMAGYLGPDSIAVQCTYFEKSAENNWLVAMHQDLSIPVAARVDDARLRGWSRKEGTLFVQAPQQVLDQIVAVRVHLDDCTPDDGPLRVVPGSHRAGILDAAGASALRAVTGDTVCGARAGDVLAMRPLLLHASSKSSGSSRRRVLHFVFGPRVLPFGLAWPAPV